MKVDSRVKSTLQDRTLNIFKATALLAKWRTIKMVIRNPKLSGDPSVDDPLVDGQARDLSLASVLSVSELGLFYCVPKGDGVCAEDGDYPEVENGAFSPGPCQQFYTGYSTRLCVNGAFQEPSFDSCVQQVILDFHYVQESQKMRRGIYFSTSKPVYNGLVEEFNTFDPIPEGMTLDAKTGELSGVPVTMADSKRIFIRATNQAGMVETSLYVSVQESWCDEEPGFPRSVVYTEISTPCGALGSYVGQITKVCAGGKVDNVAWKTVKGGCVKVTVLVTVIVVASVLVTGSILGVCAYAVIQRKKQANADMQVALLGERKKAGAMVKPPPKQERSARKKRSAFDGDGTSARESV